MLDLPSSSWRIDLPIGGRRTQTCLLVRKSLEHVGAYVLPKVSNVEEDNVKSIQGFAAMIRQLTGTSLTELMWFQSC